jgi:hypothetical protein
VMAKPMSPSVSGRVMSEREWMAMAVPFGLGLLSRFADQCWPIRHRTSIAHWSREQLA